MSNKVSLTTLITYVWQQLLCFTKVRFLNFPKQIVGKKIQRYTISGNGGKQGLKISSVSVNHFRRAIGFPHREKHPMLNRH